MKYILYKMRARMSRFYFCLLQFPSNITWVACVQYLFYLILYYTKSTTCIMFKYMFYNM